MTAERTSLASRPPDYIDESLNGITGAKDAETTKLVLALVAQEIRWRLDKLDLLPR